MSVTIRKYRRGGWEADIRLSLPDGTPWRERKKAPVSSRSGAERWAKAREEYIIRYGPPKPHKEVPTV